MGSGSFFGGSWATSGADVGGALDEDFDLSAQAVTTSDAVMSGVSGPTGGVLIVEGFSDELLVDPLAFVVGAAKSQLGRVRRDAKVLATVGVAGVAGPGFLPGRPHPARAYPAQLDLAIAGQRGRSLSASVDLKPPSPRVLERR